MCHVNNVILVHFHTHNDDDALPQFVPNRLHYWRHCGVNKIANHIAFISLEECESHDPKSTIYQYAIAIRKSRPIDWVGMWTHPASKALVMYLDRRLRT